MASQRTRNSARTNSRTGSPFNIPDVGPRFGSTKLATAAIRGALTVVALSALLLVAARPVQAQTETVLYNFTGGADGFHPEASLISDGAGNLYGTTLLGGMGCPGNQYGCGVVFKISPNGGGGWKQTVLHSFSGPPDAANPFLAPLIIDKAGNLYGTTEFGGAYNWGAVYELSPVGTSWEVTILYSFTGGADGGHPATGLIMDRAGNLYGTTSEYLAPGNVFELSPSGGGWRLQVIYAAPTAPGLTLDAAGNIYGATASTVFELSPNGHGGWEPTVLHTFTGTPNDGYSAWGTFGLDKAGNLYGTTYVGGTYNYGTVYKLSPGASGEWTEQILHSFNGEDGANPVAAGVAFDAAGNIYGTTGLGGSKNKGTVFELATLGSAKYEYAVLWNFNGTDGFNPYCTPLLDSAGNLYGTTASGGASNAGVVFKVTGVRAVTSTTLTSSLNPSIYGQRVTFSASVTTAGALPPTGNVAFTWGGMYSIGTATLNSSGVATLTKSNLNADPYPLTAVYRGDANNLSSSSPVVNQLVLETTSAATITASPNPSTLGQAVTFSAKITSPTATPTGPVTFTAGKTVLGTGQLSGGKATFTTASLPAGSRVVTVTYNGDSNIAKSTASVTQVVKP
jgi:uncharacterized repeat protein (TIGR03803 family)